MKQKLTQLFDHLVAQALHHTTPAKDACAYAREAAFLASQIGAVPDVTLATAPDWIPISKQEPPRMEETPETNGFFLLLRHNPQRDALGQYRMHLWFGRVPIDASYWARIPALPNRTASEPVGVVIPDVTVTLDGTTDRTDSPATPTDRIPMRPALELLEELRQQLVDREPFWRVEPNQPNEEFAVLGQHQDSVVIETLQCVQKACAYVVQGGRGISSTQEFLRDFLANYKQRFGAE